MGTIIKLVCEYLQSRNLLLFFFGLSLDGACFILKFYMKSAGLAGLQLSQESTVINDECLSLQIRECEQVIIEDRIEKEKSKNKIEQDLLELKSVIKVKNHNQYLAIAGLTLRNTKEFLIRYQTHLSIPRNCKSEKHGLLLLLEFADTVHGAGRRLT